MHKMITDDQGGNQGGPDTQGRGQGWAQGGPDTQGQGQGGAPDTQGQGREGHCHCLVSEIGGNLLGYYWHGSLICPVQAYFVPNQMQFDHFGKKIYLFHSPDKKLRGKSSFVC